LSKKKLRIIFIFLQVLYFLGNFNFLKIKILQLDLRKLLELKNKGSRGSCQKKEIAWFSSKIWIWKIWEKMQKFVFFWNEIWGIFDKILSENFWMEFSFQLIRVRFKNEHQQSILFFIEMRFKNAPFPTLPTDISIQSKIKILRDEFKNSTQRTPAEDQ